MSEAIRSDAQIAGDVADAIRWDTRVQAEGLRVTCQDGIVTLTGNVRLLVQRNLAADDAWQIQGVGQVIDNLAVSPFAERTDAEIMADLIAALKRQTKIDLHSVVLQVSGGVVTLAGTVRDAEERRAGEVAAWEIPGVLEVDNRLDAAPNQLRPDPEVVADVREHLLRDAAILDATGIAVEAALGRVTLSGTVIRAEDRQRAEDDARFVAGVRAVDNQIRVAPKSRTA